MECVISLNKLTWTYTLAHSWILSWAKPRILTQRPIPGTGLRPERWPSFHSPFCCNTFTCKVWRGALHFESKWGRPHNSATSKLCKAMMCVGPELAKDYMTKIQQKTYTSAQDEYHVFWQIKWTPFNQGLHWQLRESKQHCCVCKGRVEAADAWKETQRAEFQDHLAVQRPVANESVWWTSGIFSKKKAICGSKRELFHWP